jgi:hypothetical protein
MRIDNIMVSASDYYGESIRLNTPDWQGLFTSFLQLLHIDIPVSYNNQK